MNAKIVAMREAANLTQKQAASRLNISQPHYCNIERGKRQRNMTYLMMENMSKVFQVPLSEVVAAISSNQSNSVFDDPPDEQKGGSHAESPRNGRIC